MMWQKPDINYWNNKLAAYMHDPPDKALNTKGYIGRATELMRLFGIAMPDEKFWKRADGIASGFERGQIMGYSPDESMDGFVDFLKNPIITHPVGKECRLKIDLNGNADSRMKGFISERIGTKPGTGGYSDNFKGDEAKFAAARFFYVHLALRFGLSENNIGGIGALWHRLPADTRFPDHSIWQHNALVSAIQSCFKLAGIEQNIGITVFSIAPVQGYISKARKLRDYWTGSVLLSWLAFEGIKWVMENLGPDHIIYPSLIDQPLIDEYLHKDWNLDGEKAGFLNKDKSIASFPNKFSFLIPVNYANEISKEIERHIKNEWKKLNNLIIDELIDKEDVENVRLMFERQNSNFWDMQWASVRMLGKNDMTDIENLLSDKNYENQSDLLDIFLEMTKNEECRMESGKGVLYSVSHSLCQSVLAAQKTKKVVKRSPETGEMCQMCGEFEVLHNAEYRNDISAPEYKKNINLFWKQLRNKLGIELSEHERLCSICFTKRFAYRALKGNKKHILNSSFEESESFPTTTYMSLHSYFEREKIKGEKEKKEAVREVFEADPNDIGKNKRLKRKGIDIRDRYYAILLMDGDLTGRLVNGETIASTWRSVIHPDIVDKIKNKKLTGDHNELWQNIFDGINLKGYEHERLKNRLLTPSIHTVISESLGDFSLYGVAPIIKKYEGRLIYAGGDDMCAVLPIDNALTAAEEIQEYYKSYFRFIKRDKKGGIISRNLKCDGKRAWKPDAGKLSVNLGKGKDITISAGILICHHKEDLSDMIKRAHILLNEKAKGEGGRNAVAVEHKKRNGGSRYFVEKWDSDRFAAFKDLIGSKIVGEELSRSLAYRLEEFRDGIEVTLRHDDEDNLLNKFILSQLKKAENKRKLENDEDKNYEKLSELSRKIGKVVIDNDNNFGNEGIIIAGFLNQSIRKQEIE